jgi:four helix bundle protein
MDYKAENDKLLERLTKFAEKVIELCLKLPQTAINSPLINQLIRACSSIGANYSEACGAESSKDFVHKTKISYKESRETKFFLRLILKANPAFAKEIIPLGQESFEYIKIFSTILSKFKNKII